MWLVTITVTTVGYGDIYACTLPGQIITLFMAITGTFLMAMVVTIVSDNFSLDSQRQVALNHYIVTRKAATCVQKSI